MIKAYLETYCTSKGFEDLEDEDGTIRYEIDYDIAKYLMRKDLLIHPLINNEVKVKYRFWVIKEGQGWDNGHNPEEHKYLVIQTSDYKSSRDGSTPIPKFT